MDVGDSMAVLPNRKLKSGNGSERKYKWSITNEEYMNRRNSNIRTVENRMSKIGCEEKRESGRGRYRVERATEECESSE